MELIESDIMNIRAALVQVKKSLSSGGIRKVIRRLKDAKLLRRFGPDKGDHWEVSR